ncbi:oxidoreductase, partial [Methylobacterium radiotolerans]
MTHALPEHYRALRVVKGDDGQPRAEFQTLPSTELPTGDVTVQVTHSSLNYKDGMAVAGRPGILKRHPMTPGIDLAGTVLHARPGEFTAGGGRADYRLGPGRAARRGYATLARVPAAWLTRLPHGTDAQWAMTRGHRRVHR